MKRIITVAGIAVTLLLAGCVGMFSIGGQRHHRSSTLVEFLYGGGLPPAEAQVPELQLPLTVGLAFLPQANGPAALDEAEKSQILDRIRARFMSRRFVHDIIEIPSHYLSPEAGVDGLAALQRLYGMDLLALVSYDQLSHQDDNLLSLTYMSIVGAYLFPGTSQDVTTVVDLAVIDPESRSLVLRAAGMDSRDGSVPEAGAEMRLRQRRMAGLNAAADQVIERFDTELTRFETEVRSGRGRVKVVNAGGGGGVDAFAILLLLVAVAFRAVRNPRPAGSHPGESFTASYQRIPTCDALPGLRVPGARPPTLPQS